ncbi:MAG TPA: TatD family hydrolase [Phycisphaerae bacterium]|jgi:TatD DNase family protein
MIDSHAHLTYDPLYAIVDEVLRAAAAAGVEQVISVGTDAADWRRAVDLAERREPVLAALGVHPHHAAEALDTDFATLGELLKHPRVVAAGEMGLDYHYDFSDRASQQRVFERQLELARGTDLPIIIHSREAQADVVATLVRRGFEGRRVVFHCFTGTRAEADEIAAHGWRISFTGVVTFKKSQDLQAIAAAYPADQLMLETDSPYLSPEPVRSTRPNTPAHLAHIAAFLAALRSTSAEQLGSTTAANTRQFFRRLLS